MSSHQENDCLLPPPQGGCGIVNQPQTPQATRTFCSLWQLVPTWHKDSNIKGCLQPPPRGGQGMPPNAAFPSLWAPATSKAGSGQQTPAPSKAPFPREGLCNPGPEDALPPLLDQLKSSPPGTPDYSPVQSQGNALTRQNIIFRS